MPPDAGPDSPRILLKNVHRIRDLIYSAPRILRKSGLGRNAPQGGPDGQVRRPVPGAELRPPCSQRSLRTARLKSRAMLPDTLELGLAGQVSAMRKGIRAGLRPAG